MEKRGATRPGRARRFTPRTISGDLRAFQNPRYRPWLALRGWAALHALIGTGWIFVAVWLDDHGTGPLWTVWAVMLALWFVPLVWISRRARALRTDAGVLRPYTVRLFLAAVVAVELGSWASLLAPAGLTDLLLPMWFINLGVAIWVALTGLSFLATRIPFSWSHWLGTVILMALMVPAFGLGVLCRIWGH